MKARELDGDDEVELPPTEAARDRRRDHDLRAVEREGMRTGLAKQFKQVLDAQVKRGHEADQEARLDERPIARAEDVASSAPAFRTATGLKPWLAAGARRPRDARGRRPRRCVPQPSAHSVGERSLRHR